jgi:hypothetical protein
MLNRFVPLAALAVIFLCVTAAQAADPAIKCESSKLKESGKYSNCRLKADSKGVKKGLPADYTKCETKFSDKWGKAETKAGPTVCPSEGDAGSMDARITANAAEIAILLTGVRYEDTGLGTVIDHETGLEWQKTDDAGGLTDKDNTYSWTGDGVGGTAANGTAFGTFLEGLNGGTASSGSGPTTAGYAGHNDWRIPRIEELTTIVDCSFGNPCIDQSVFGATNASSVYWSASTVNVVSDGAWFVGFGIGDTVISFKDSVVQVRAVRGGS